jgi:uncharacterized membrane protein YhaH (DUF805 family)
MNQNLTPVDWAKRPIEKYADFGGRAPRAEYWWFVLALIVVYIVLSIVEGIVGINHMIFGAYGPLTALLWLATIVPSIAVSVRRLHDTNRSGWWLLLPVIPYCLALLLGGAAIFRVAAGGAGQPGMMAGLGVASIFLMIGAVGWIVLLVFYVLPGTPGDNRFGPNPYGVGGASAAA